MMDEWSIGTDAGGLGVAYQAMRGHDACSGWRDNFNPPERCEVRYAK